MLKNIKTIIYEKNFAFSNKQYFQLDIYEDKNVLKYNDGDNIKNVNDDLAMQYVEQLFRIIDGWKNIYENNSILDGGEWKLEITYKDGEIKHYYGKNEFPNNFEYLDKIKNELISKI